MRAFQLKFLKPAILSLSLLTILMNAAVVPVLSQINQAFPEAGSNLIKLVLSLPALTNIIFSLIAGQLAGFIPRKYILIAALILYSGSGIGSGMANSISMLLVGRALLGAGTGLISPLVTDLIAYFYQGNERIRMIGYSNASSNLSGIFLPLLAGWLAAFSWRYAFWVYGIGILVLIIAWLFIPVTPVNSRQKDQQAQLFAQKPVSSIAFSNFLVVLVFYSLPANLSLFVQQEKIGAPTIAALAISISTLTSTIIGMVFSKFYQRFKHRLPILGLLFCSLGFFTVGFLPGITALMASEILVGIGIGILFPYFSLRVTQVSSSRGLTSGLALLSAAFGLGIFVSPFFFLLLKQIVKFSSIRSELLISALLFGLGCIYMAIKARNEPDFIKES